MKKAVIRRIKAIGDYRAFKGWSDGDRPKQFQRVNLIYGRNGSGKSTLASLFREVALGELIDPIPRLEIEVETAGVWATLSETETTFWTSVMVFNADYVRENLRFDDAHRPSSKSLLTLGKPNLEIETELEVAEAKVVEMTPILQRAKEASESANSRLQQRLKAVASAVVDNLRRSADRKYRATNSYTKADVRQRLEGDLSVFDDASTDFAADSASAVSAPMNPATLSSRAYMADASIVDRARALVRRDITVAVLEELRGKEDLAAWVQTGIPLHEHLHACMFCGQPLTARRREELLAHFSDALTSMQREADKLVSELQTSVDNSEIYQGQLPGEADLYPEFREELRERRREYNDAHGRYAESASHLAEALRSKRTNPFQVPAIDSRLMLKAPFTEAIEAIISKHRERCGSHSVDANEAARRVELFIVGDFRAEYGELKEYSLAKDKVAEDLEQEIRDLNERVTALKSANADPTPKADELTRNVERLLGRGDLKFTTTSDGKHYAIERDGSPATHLSEGERTAVALLHFLASIRDDVVGGVEPVVVIDDPVSSMDESILFGASSYLWTELVSKRFARQVFLLTHNFELFRQWIIQLEKAKKHIADGFTIHELRMRFAADSSGLKKQRSPQFDPWTNDEKQSRRLRSLYHFLFARVASAVIEASPEVNIAERMDLLALAPNAARKMLEAFLSFRFPEQIGDFHAGMYAALKSVQDRTTRNQVERYLHSYSHNEEGDISAAVDPSEATVVLRAIFEMMQVVDPDHFSAMCKALLIDEADLLQIPRSMAERRE